MEQRLEQLLDECLSQLNTGQADLETILAEHPEHAERLRPLLRVALAVRQTPQPTPSRAAKAAGRQRLLVAAARKRQQREAARRGVRRYLDGLAGFLNWISQPNQPLRRAVVYAMAVMLVLVVMGAGVTQVAARSLPDTPLYPVKLASERIQLALAPSPAERARLHSVFGQRRLQEAQMLAQAGRPVNAVLAEMVKQNKQAFGAIAQVPTEQRVPLLEELAQLTKTERQTLSELKEALPLPDKVAISEAIALSAEDQARAEAARLHPEFVPLIPTHVPPTLTPFVPTVTPVLPTATAIQPTATPVEVVVPPPDKPEEPRPTLVPTKEVLLAPTATPTTEVIVGEQEVEQPTVTPTLTNTVAPLPPTPVPEEPSPTPQPTETPIPTASPTPVVVEPTMPPPPTLPAP